MRSLYAHPARQPSALQARLSCPLLRAEVVRRGLACAPQVWPHKEFKFYLQWTGWFVKDKVAHARIEPKVSWEGFKVLKADDTSDERVEPVAKTGFMTVPAWDDLHPFADTPVMLADLLTTAVTKSVETILDTSLNAIDDVRSFNSITRWGVRPPWPALSDMKTTETVKAPVCCVTAPLHGSRLAAATCILCLRACTRCPVPSVDALTLYSHTVPLPAP